MTTPSHSGSEMRRSAGALLGTRSESFASARDDAACHERLDEVLRESGKLRFTTLAGAWKRTDGEAVYEATFTPSRRTTIALRAVSLGMGALFVASAALLYSGRGGAALRFLLPMCTLFAMLAVPIVVQGLASQREAEEARLTRAIRAALQGTEESFPPPQRWPDED